MNNIPKYVIDTQALIKFLNGQKVFNSKIHNILKKADESENLIIIPSIVLCEIAYLNEKNRISISLKSINDILENSINYVEEKLSIDIINASFEIKDIPELHDRLIAGTARFLDVPIITNDPIILNSKFIKTII